MTLRPSEIKRQRRYRAKMKKLSICLKCHGDSNHKTYCNTCMITKRKPYTKRYPTVSNTIRTRHTIVTSSFDPNSLFFDIDVIIKLINKELHNYNPTF